MSRKALHLLQALLTVTAIFAIYKGFRLIALPGAEILEKAIKVPMVRYEVGMEGILDLG